MNYKLSDDKKILYNVDKDVTSFNIPNTIEKIYQFAFKDCVYLTSIIIPDNVKEICYCAFINRISLKNIIISNNVIRLGSHVFVNCTNLETITLHPNIINEDEHSGYNIFYKNNKLFNINSLSNDKLKYAFGYYPNVEEKYYIEYIQRNREYKLNKLY